MAKILLYKQLPDYIRQAIEDGVDRTLCPTCQGGSGREYSLSIRPDGDVTIKLSCWRSTCDWYAYTVTDKTATFDARKVKPARPYEAPTMPVQGATLATLRQAYGLNDDEWEAHGWTQHEFTDTLVMPIRCPNGGVRGHITRTFDTSKRCMTYKTTAQPWLDHWPTDDGRPVVIVEDTLSACRLAGLGYHAVALLGTSITVEQAQEIRDLNTVIKGADVFLALDQDATVKAMKLARRHQHIVHMQPICLTEDIKSMESDVDIHTLFTRTGS